MSDVEHFAVSVSLEPERARLSLRGELDMSAAPILRDRLEHTLNGNGSGRPLVLVDLTDLTYCDSAGIHTLLQAAAQCQRRGRTFRIIGVRPSVRRVFEITNTIEGLNVETDD